MQISPPTKYSLAFCAIVCISLFFILIVKGERKNEDSTHSVDTIQLNSAMLVQRSEKKVTSSPRPLPQLPDIHAESYLVQLIASDIPLARRDAARILHPASLTKILTSLIAMEELEHDSSVVFSSYAKATGEKESAVPAGEVFGRDDAVRFAMIESANDAAVALAEAVGRLRGAFSFEDALSIFLALANKRAQEIGMTHSLFQNPTGLDDTNHLSTAEDLFRLAEYVWENHRAIWNFSRASETDIRSRSGAFYHIAATNQLVSEFPALQGGKTGMTDHQKGALILLYPVQSDQIAVIVILGSDDRFGDGAKLIHWLEESFQE